MSVSNKNASNKTVVSEAKRLEALWAGAFGNEYNERNKNAYAGRANFWIKLLSKFKPQNILEVGCNVGGNLKCISERIPPRRLWGIDINKNAIKEIRHSLPGVNAVWSPARELPFRDGFFDLVFTAGVLIHQPEDSLLDVMSEVVRCSRRHVLCLEYFSKEATEIPYRGNARALFKRDYGKIYAKNFPTLKLMLQGELKKSDGWDDVTYWLFKKGKAKNGS